MDELAGAVHGLVLEDGEQGERDDGGAGQVAARVQRVARRRRLEQKQSYKDEDLGRYAGTVVRGINAEGTEA